MNVYFLKKSCKSCGLHIYMCLCILNIFVYGCFFNNTRTLIQLIADIVAQHLEIISKTFPMNQNSAHEIYE